MPSAEDSLNPLAALHVFAAHLDARARAGDERIWLSPEARAALKEICRMKPGRMVFKKPSVPTPTPTLTPAPIPAKPEPKTGPEPQAGGSRGCSEGTERNHRTANEQDQSPGRGDRIDRPPNLTRSQKEAALAEIARRAEVSPKARSLGTLRDTMVFATGNPEAEIMLVGEAPGAVEERMREPFTGPAGATLDRILKAMGLERSEVYISNICKFRPAIEGNNQGSKNRKPTAEEMDSCLEYVHGEISIIQPRVIIALGGTAAEGLLKKPVAVTRARGQWMECQGIPLMITFHPSYILRKEEEGEEIANAEKRKLWEDMMKVMERAGMEITEKQKRYFLPKNR